MDRGGSEGERKEEEGGRVLILRVCDIPVDVHTVSNSVNYALQVSM